MELDMVADKEIDKVAEMVADHDPSLVLVKGSCQKKTVFLGNLSQICLPTHPPQGFCEIWENER